MQGYLRQSFFAPLRFCPAFLQLASEGFDVRSPDRRATARVMEALAIIEPRRPMPDNRESAYAAKIQKARVYLTENFEQVIDMYALAKHHGISYSLFRRLFKTHTGRAPQKYLIDIRIDKARELLRHTDLSVSEIAQKTGFSSIYFFHAFLKDGKDAVPWAIGRVWAKASNSQKLPCREVNGWRCAV